MNKKNAICMLCMLKNHYVVGACIAAFAHKSLIYSHNLDIDVIVMCDEYIYDKYKHTLKFYFDKVIKINLIKVNTETDKNLFDEKSKEYYNNKYSWLNYSLNKWQCLKYVKYEKILFIDVDIIPVSEKLYDIFTFNTPAFLLYEKSNILPPCKNNDALINFLKNINSYGEYTDLLNKYKKSVGPDGGFLLLKPNKNHYDKYMEFIDDVLKKNHNTIPGIGIDESTIMYFYAKVMDVPIYRICYNYNHIPWKFSKNYYMITEKDDIYSYNYLSRIKPWLKTKFMSWNEEWIWRDLYKIMMKTKMFNNAYKKYILNEIDEYKKSKNGNQYNRSYYDELVNKTIEFNDITMLEKKLIHDDKNYGVLNKNNVKNLFDSIIKYKRHRESNI